MAATGGWLLLVAPAPGSAAALADDVKPPAPEHAAEIPGVRERSGRLLVKSRPGGAARVAAALEGLESDQAKPLHIWSVAVPPGETEESFAARLRARHGELFEWIRPDWRVFVQEAPAVEPSDPQFPLQWHHAAVGMPYAWRTATGLPEVALAFVDTGVDLSHPDLAGNLVPGYCSYLTVRLPQGDLGMVDDAHGHGTSVAGTAAAVGNNALGTAGLGWNMSIMPVRATNPAWPTGSATSMDIINGALWASDHGARVVNVSFSGVSEPYVQDLGAELRRRRVLLVWPIDNYSIDYGASFDHPDVLVVAGTTSSDGRYSASSYGLGVDLAAPAAAIWSTDRGGSAGYHTGNSFAAPVVSGVAGVILSAASELTPAQVERILVETATDLGAPGRDPYFGHGRIDAAAAVWLAPLRQFALGAAPAPAVRERYNVDDLYRQFDQPRDIDGNGQIDAADAAAVRGLLRYDEATETTFRR